MKRKNPEARCARDFLFTSDRDEEEVLAAAVEAVAPPNDACPSVEVVAVAEARTNASAAVEVAMEAMAASNDVSRDDAGRVSAVWRSRVKPRSCQRARCRRRGR